MLEVASSPPKVPPLPPRLVLTIPDCCDPRTTFPSGVDPPAELPAKVLVAAVAVPPVTEVTTPVPSLDVVLGGELEAVGDGLVPEVASGTGESSLRCLRLRCLLGGRLAPEFVMHCMIILCEARTNVLIDVSMNTVLDRCQHRCNMLEPD